MTPTGSARARDRRRRDRAAGRRPIVDANARLHYDSEIGALADAPSRRAQSGARCSPTPTGGNPTRPRSRRRDAGPVAPAAGRARPDGRRRHGRRAGWSTRVLLAVDATRRSGCASTTTPSSSAFDVAWSDRSVVLVEASDLARGRSLPAVRVGRRADAASGELALRRDRRAVRPAAGRVRPHDAVIVVGPAHSEDGVTLTPLAIRGPGYRRARAPHLVDDAPRRLRADPGHRADDPRLVGLPIPTSMEGERDRERPAAWAVDRLEFLADADAAAQFRDDRIGEVYALLVVAVAVTVGLVFAVRHARGGRWRGAAGFTAFATLGLIPATFLARLVPFQDHGARRVLRVLARRARWRWAASAHWWRVAT